MSRGSGLALLGARGRYERNKGIATSNKVQYIYIYISLSLSLPKPGQFPAWYVTRGIGQWAHGAAGLFF